MDDPFELSASPGEEPPSFDEAARQAVTELSAAAERFEALQESLDPEVFTADEWRIVEQAATAISTAAERAEEGYIAVMYDGHAWYRILESTNEVRRRLESAIGVMTLVAERLQSEE